jgi:hypothetical protein
LVELHVSVVAPPAVIDVGDAVSRTDTGGQFTVTDALAVAL